MNLSEMRDLEAKRLLAQAQEEVKQGEVVEDEDDDDEDDDETELREELDLALSMLKDACNTIEGIIELGQNARINHMTFKELIDRSCEINAYLDQYDFTEEKKDEDFPVLDMDTLEWKS